MRTRLAFAATVAAALFFAAWPLRLAVADSSAEPRRALLRAQLDHARAEERRWQRLIDTERDLAQHPDRFSAAAEDAARTLKASGRDLVIEGVTGGLSSSLSLMAYNVGEKTPSGRNFARAAAASKAAYSDFIEEHLASENSGEKSSEKNKKAIEKLENTIGFATTFVKDPKFAEAVKASGSMHVAALQFLNAYFDDDEPGMQKYLPGTKAMLEGTLDVMRGLSIHRPETLEGYLKAVAKEVPEFGPIAKNIAVAGTEEAAFVISLANVAFGSAGIARGFELSAQAEEIRDNQMQAARRLHDLLPRARTELAAAQREEQRITAALGGRADSTSQTRTVLPSERFMDDAAGTPSQAGHASAVAATLEQRATIQHGLTPDTLARLGQEFKQKSDADLARREAERRALERAMREAEAERRGLERARSQAQQYGSRSSPEARSSSTGREYGNHSYDLSHARAVVNSAMGFHF